MTKRRRYLFTILFFLGVSCAPTTEKVSPVEPSKATETKDDIIPKGYYHIVSNADGLCLDRKNGDDTELQMIGCNDSILQKFYFTQDNLNPETFNIWVAASPIGSPTFVQVNPADPSSRKVQAIPPSPVASIGRWYAEGSASSIKFRSEYKVDRPLCMERRRGGDPRLIFAEPCTDVDVQRWHVVPW